MKIVIIIFSFVTVIYAQDIFSVKQGNHWTYQNIDDNNILLIKEVIAEVDTNSQKGIIVSNTYKNYWAQDNQELWFVDSIYFKYSTFSMLYGFNHFGFDKNIENDTTIMHGPSIATYNTIIFGENVLTQRWDYSYSQIGEVWLSDMTIVSEKFGVVEFSYSFGGPGGRGKYHFKLIEAYIDGITYKREVTSVENKGKKNNEYSLSQNYPNPYNPTTKIKYSIGTPGNVEITVFNILGQKIIDLVSEYKMVGEYEVQFNAENLSNGIYLYRITSGSYTESKKMIVIK